MTTPIHCIDQCPICGDGLLGIRICPGRIAAIPSIPKSDDIASDPQKDVAADSQDVASDSQDASSTDNTLVPESAHGLVVCDECEAIWLEPDSSSMHLYSDAESPQCPRCDRSLWECSHWANQEEITWLGWSEKVNPDLDAVASDETTESEGTEET